MAEEGDKGNHGPHFELVTFSEPTGIPKGWDTELLRQGVPKEMFGQFVAVPTLMLLDIPSLGPYVWFATNGLSTRRVCLDPRTGAVVELLYDSTALVPPPDALYGSPRFVNSSLEQFIISVREVIARFPFDSGGSTTGRDLDEKGQDRLQDEWDQAVKDLRAALQHIDQASVDGDGFWTTFLDDVQMGDFASEIVLSSER